MGMRIQYLLPLVATIGTYGSSKDRAHKKTDQGQGIEEAEEEDTTNERKCGG